jgi:hypothetical protein
MMRRLAIPVALLIATAGGGSGYSSENEGARTGTTDEAPAAVTISATDYAFEAPDTLQAGWTRVRLVNQGDQPHSATLVRFDRGRTLPEYIRAYGEANRTRSARPDWARFLGGPVALLPHSERNATLHLEPGNYAWVCLAPGPDHISHLLAHNQAHAFVVRPGSGDAPAPKPPEPTVSLRMLDYSFELSAPLKAGKQVMRIENVGAEPHHVLIFKPAPGRTMEDFQSRDLDLFEAWLWNHVQGEAPVTFVGAMEAESPGAEAYLELELPAGDYVFVCLLAGRDGVPHIAKGMIQHVRVD